MLIKILGTAHNTLKYTRIIDKLKSIYKKSLLIDTVKVQTFFTLISRNTLEKPQRKPK